MLKKNFFRLDKIYIKLLSRFEGVISTVENTVRLYCMYTLILFNYFLVVEIGICKQADTRGKGLGIRKPWALGQ